MIGRKPSCRPSTSQGSRTEHGLGSSFRFAGRGLRFALKERNLRLHLLAAAITLAAGFWFRILAWQWGVLVLAITLVILAELINTALECVVDLASPGYAELARMAKDVAAGAVLFTALAALALANLIFAPVLAKPLLALRNSISALPGGVAAILILSVPALLQRDWPEWGSRQRMFALLAAALGVAGARAFVAWPRLPVMLAAALLLFIVWVAGFYRRVSTYTLALVPWVLFWIWLWQRGM